MGGNNHQPRKNRSKSRRGAQGAAQHPETHEAVVGCCILRPGPYQPLTHQAIYYQPLTRNHASSYRLYFFAAVASVHFQPRPTSSSYNLNFLLNAVLEYNNAVPLRVSLRD